MGMFSNSLIQGLINPSFGDNLSQVGMLAGSYDGRRREKQEEEAKKALVAQRMSTLMQDESPQRIRQGAAELFQTNPEASKMLMDRAAEMSAKMAQLTGVPEGGARAAKNTMLGKQATAKADSAFKDTLSSMLSQKGQEGYSNLISQVPDFGALPNEVQKRVLTAAGIVDEGEQAMARSPEGKRSMDRGFIPGTKEFQEDVTRQMKVLNSEASVEAFNAISGVVNQQVDSKKTHKINDAVTAISSSGLAGSEALQENTIIDLFGSALRAEAAVKRFGSSASLPRRVTDSISLWATGSKTNLTNEDREAIIYSAIKMQEAALDSAVNNSAQALSVDEKLIPNVRAVYSFPSYTQEWVDRYEKKYSETKQKPSSAPERVRYDAQGNRL